MASSSSVSSKSGGGEARSVAGGDSQGGDFTCRFCWRSSRTKNPCPSKHPGEYLNFDASDKKKCLICKSFVKTCYKGHTMDELTTQCADKDFRAKYTDALELYESAFDSTTGRLRNIAEKMKPPTFVTATHECGMTGEMNCGVFWPKKLYEDKTQLKLQKKDQVKYNYHGKQLIGIIRDASHGAPTGSITLKGTETSKIAKTMEISSSDTTLRAGEADDAFNRALGSLSSTTIKETSVMDDEGNETTILKVAKRSSKELEAHPSDESGDWTRMVRPCLQPAAAKADHETDDEAAASSAGHRCGLTRSVPGPHSAKCIVGMLAWVQGLGIQELDSEDGFTGDRGLGKCATDAMMVGSVFGSPKRMIRNTP